MAHRIVEIMGGTMGCQLYRAYAGVAAFSAFSLARCLRMYSRMYTRW